MVTRGWRSPLMHGISRIVPGPVIFVMHYTGPPFSRVSSPTSWAPSISLYITLRCGNEQNKSQHTEITATKPHDLLGLH